MVQPYCHAINVTDNVGATPSMDALAAAHLVLDAGVEPILQISGRDRNRIALQSLLYGAAALGVRNLLFITGDYPDLATHPHAKPVFDYDSVEALRIASTLMGGVDISGAEIDGAPQFFLGSTFNPCGEPYDLHLMRLRMKYETGARFFQTQAIFDIKRFADFMTHVRPLDVWVIAGAMFLRSLEVAEALAAFPGVRIPREVIYRLGRAGRGIDDEEERLAAEAEEGMRIAVETVRALAEVPGVSGIHIMSVGWVDAIPDVLSEAGLVSAVTNRR